MESDVFFSPLSMASLPVTILNQPSDLPPVLSVFDTPRYSNPYVEASPDVPHFIRYPPIVLENTVHTAVFNRGQDMQRMQRSLAPFGCQLSKTRPRISLKMYLLTIAAFQFSAVCTGARSHEEATEGFLSFQNAVLLGKEVVGGMKTAAGGGGDPGVAEGDIIVAEGDEEIALEELTDDAIDRLAAEIESGKKRARPRERDFAVLKPPAPGRRRYDGLDTGHSRIGKVGFIEAVVVQNVVGTLRTGMAISLPITHRDVLPDRSSYTPRNFPGLILTGIYYPRILGTPDTFKPSLTLFSSGSAIITGAKTMGEIYQGACIAASYIWRTFCLMQQEPNALISILFSNNIDIITFQPVLQYLMEHNKGVPSELQAYASRHDLINSSSGTGGAVDDDMVSIGLVRKEVMQFNEILSRMSLIDSSRAAAERSGSPAAPTSSSSSLSSTASSRQASPVVRVQSTTASPLGKRQSVSPIPIAKRDAQTPTNSTVAPLSSLTTTFPR